MSHHPRTHSSRHQHRATPPPAVAPAPTPPAISEASPTPDLPSHVTRLGESSRRAIAAAEARLGGKVVAFWQSQHASFDLDDVQALRRILPAQPVPVLHFCLTSYGGNGSAAIVLGNVLRSVCQRLIVHIPVIAASAGTMLAMHGDEIRLATGAYVTAVDSTFTAGPNIYINEVEFLRLRTRAPKGRPHRPGMADGYEHLYAHMSPTIVGHALRTMDNTRRLCEQALAHLPASRRRRVIKVLLSNCPTHNFPVFQQQARACGLPATVMPADEQAIMLGLHDLHVQYGRMHRSMRDPLLWRETTMRTIVATADHTAAQICDGEQAREKLGGEWHEVWRNNGWRTLDPSGACPRMPVELVP